MTNDLLEISDVYDGSFVMIKQDGRHVSLDRYQQYEVYVYLRTKIGEGR